MPLWLRHHLLIVAIAAAVLFFRLGDARLWDRDEPRNAQCAVEMLERADWVVPSFNAELRTHKPVLLYWLIMSAYTLFGVNEFAARFWSAALGVGTVLCTYHLGTRLFHRTAGLWAALALAPALMFDVASRAATPDAALIFCVTATLCAYVQFAFTSPHKPAGERSDTVCTSRREGVGSLWRRMVFPMISSFSAKDSRPPDVQTVSPLSEPHFPRSWWAGATIYGLMALAVLAKGPVGLVLPIAIIAGSLWIWRCLSWRAELTHLPQDKLGSPPEIAWQFRLRLIAPLRQIGTLIRELQPLTALAMLLLIALPWYAWVGWRTEGEFLFGFFWDHNVRRATQSMEGHSGPAFLFYPATLLIGFFPASIFLFPSLLDARRQLLAGTRQGAAIVLCLVWIIVVVGLFSLAKTKLPSYVTPCYPALAVLVGGALHRWTNGELAISSLWLRWSLAWSIAVGVAVVIAIPLVATRYLPGEQWLAAIGLVLVAGGGAALFCEWRLRSRERAVAISLGTGVLFSLLLFGLGPAAADRHQQSHLLLAILRNAQPEDVAAWRCLEPSWVFYLGRPIRELEEADAAVKFLEQGQRTLILRAEDYTQLSGRLPLDIRILGETQRFLRNEKLLTIGRTGQHVAGRPTSADAAGTGGTR